jgi:hypothetical protein
MRVTYLNISLHRITPWSFLTDSEICIHLHTLFTHPGYDCSYTSGSFDLWKGWLATRPLSTRWFFRLSA